MSDGNDWNRAIIEEFRANGGRVGGQFAGASMLLLTTTGARTGKQHTTPLVYTTDGDRLIAIASKAGAPTHPDWYHNLVANPIVTLEVGPETFQARAAVAPPGERDRLYAAQAALMPGFAEYQKQTTRTIPVVTFERARL